MDDPSLHREDGRLEMMTDMRFWRQSCRNSQSGSDCQVPTTVHGAARGAFHRAPAAGDFLRILPQAVGRLCHRDLFREKKLSNVGRIPRSSRAGRSSNAPGASAFRGKRSRGLHVAGYGRARRTVLHVAIAHVPRRPLASPSRTAGPSRGSNCRPALPTVRSSTSGHLHARARPASGAGQRVKRSFRWNECGLQHERLGSSGPGRAPTGPKSAVDVLGSRWRRVEGLSGQ
jgi:hypothetical protein